MINFKKIGNLLDPKIKKRFYVIVIFNFFISIFEFLSVASIYPALLIITNTSESKKIEKLLSMFQLDISNKNLNFFLFLILIFIILKNVFSVFLNWFTLNYLLKNYNFISSITLKKMLKFNYLDVITLTSPIFIRNSKEIVVSFRSYIQSLLGISTEIIMVLSVFIFLLIVSLKITLVSVGILSLFLFFLLKLTKHRMTILGVIRNEGFGKLNSSLIEIYNSFRELKIFKNFDFYIKSYEKRNLDFANAQKNIDFFVSITRNLFELMIVTCLALAIYITNFEIKVSFLPTAGIFVYAFFRLYPSFTKITTLKTIINANENSLDILTSIQNHNVEKIDFQSNQDKLNFKNILKIENLCFGYDKNLVLDNLNLNINKGEIIGISGKNGSGKTTLCNIILSLIKPQRGRILIDDNYDVQNYLSEYRNIVSFIPQNIFLLNDSIKNNITFNLEEDKIYKKKLTDVIKLAGLENINNIVKLRHNSFIGENGSNLSGGQRQRIAIARALYRNSEIIIMDEHTSALDQTTEEELLNDMKKTFLGKTIIIISHREKVLDFCNTNYLLENGKLKNID